MSARVAFLVLFALCATSGTLADDDYNAIFKDAVDAVDFEFDKSWAFTETQIGSEHVWIGRFDPRRPPRDRWELLTIDGRVPSADEIEEYRKIKAYDHSDNGDKRVTALVEPGSVGLIEETDEYWLFGFNPDHDHAEVMDSLDATIRVRKSGRQLEYVDLRNHSPIRRGLGVRVSKLITRLTFGAAAEGGPVVPLSTQVEAKGRALLVVSFDEQELYRNSDFEYAGED